jgi:prepilin-type N-terminal cleavage/methylation domain-containing protein
MKYFDVDKKRRGFTLIEVLITIIIIGILSTIGITTFQSSQAKGRDFKRKADLRAVTKALESYMNDYGLYPLGTLDGKIQWCGADQGAVCSWGDPFAKTEGDQETVYMAELPKDTKSSQAYFYEAVTNETTGKNTGYRVYGRLENDKDPDIPSGGQYAANCSSDAIKRYCNYVIVSDTATEPLACKLDTTGCTAPNECCIGSCNTYYAYSALLGYTGKCAAVGFCGSPPLGYTETIGRPVGESCSSNVQCCTRSCHSFYTQSSGTTCPTTKVCSQNSSIPPNGLFSSCCLIFGASCTGSCCTGYSCCNGRCKIPTGSALTCNSGSDCCGGYCCGGVCKSSACCLANGATGCTINSQCCGGYCCSGKCQGTSCCLANGATCTSNGSCCSNVCTTFYRDSDGDHYGAGAAVKRCGTTLAGYVTNSTDCNDTGTNSKNVWVTKTCYVDADNDNYGSTTAKSCTNNATCGSATWASGGAGTAAASGNFSAINTDCYDLNANAYPNSAHCGTVNRGDGSFDYNCVGGATVCGTSYNPVYCNCANDSSCGGGCASYGIYDPACGTAGYIVTDYRRHPRRHYSVPKDACASIMCQIYGYALTTTYGTQGCQ